MKVVGQTPSLLMRLSSDWEDVAIVILTLNIVIPTVISTNIVVGNIIVIIITIIVIIISLILSCPAG